MKFLAAVVVVVAVVGVAEGRPIMDTLGDVVEGVGNFFEGVGSFFSGLFGGSRDDEKKTPSSPSSSPSFPRHDEDPVVVLPFPHTSSPHQTPPRSLPAGHQFPPVIQGTSGSLPPSIPSPVPSLPPPLLLLICHLAPTPPSPLASPCPPSLPE
ncbi:hypothetical protein O3P69_020291 [Scylla paramamosain]|uniref:Uncharacterized protein n=1 Tax=Scylla paramamosain TaxID=85552 RepID=A0AAW0SKD0_SCYPA